MEDYEMSQRELEEWFYDRKPFIEECQATMIEIYELKGYPESWDDVPWFLNGNKF